jgi:hypothetical protein
MATVDTALLDSVRVQIYRHFMDAGRAPAATDIAEVLGRDASEIEPSFVALADARVIVLAPGTRSIWMVHPFSAVPTPYRVQCGSVSYWANCAWDALGIAAMLARDTLCACRCPDCNQHLDLSVKRGALSGTGIVHFVVPPRRFWENVAFT